MQYLCNNSFAALFEHNAVKVSMRECKQLGCSSTRQPILYLFAAVVEKVKVWVSNWFCKAVAMSFKSGIDIIVLNASGVLLFTKNLDHNGRE